ncbi:MAG: retropepsin-like aspartic protease [Pseudomonadota bacterium]
MNISTKTWLAIVVIGFVGGVAWGWWYRGLSVPTSDQTAELPERSSDAAPYTDTAWANPPQVEPKHSPNRLTNQGAGQEFATDQSFAQMLSEQRFWDAAAYYYRRMGSDAADRLTLRPQFDRYLKDCRQNCETGSFLDLVDAWLATFYDDIPVLIQLAEFQEDQGQPEAAANTLLLARTYALEVDHQHAVQQARDRLTQRTDKRLGDETRWIELLGYYDFLASIDFTTPKFELRRALLYRRLGEDARARNLLRRLQAADDARDPSFTANLDRYLNEAPAATRVEENPVDVFPTAVPLEKHGTGFLVKVRFNERDTLTLLVDTGASITALTHDSFRRLYRPDLSLMGTQLFKTASGYTRGDIYSALSISLGEERVEGPTLAVLDRLDMGDIDGLLGMNILRHFRFEIDQNGSVMYLEPR